MSDIVFARERVLGSSEWFVRNYYKEIERQEIQWSTVKTAEQNPSKNFSLTFRNPTFSIDRKQNTFFSHRSCDGSIAVQNELNFETFSVPSINLRTLGSTKSSTSLKFRRQGDQLCDQPERAAALARQF